MLYKDWMNEWLELYVKPSAKERTYEKYLQQTKKYLLPALGEYEVDALTARILQRFSASLSGRNLSENTRNGIVSVLKSSLRKAVSLGIAERDFSNAVVRARPREGG